MNTKAGILSKQQKNGIRAIVFLVFFTIPMLIPFGVMYGGMGTGWMLLANVLFCIGLAVIAIGAIAWFFVRVRSLVRK
jgi:hypothetical protein